MSIDKTAPRVVNDLIAQVQRMLAREAYHYCVDCQTHCRQIILTVEALKESERLRDPRKDEALKAVYDRHKVEARDSNFEKCGCDYCQVFNASEVMGGQTE